MMLDQLFQFSTNQLVTASTVSTNAVDVSSILREIRGGADLYVDVNITETLAVANTATDVNNLAISLAIGPTQDGSVTSTLLHASTIHYNNGAEVLPTVAKGPYALAGDHIYLPVTQLSSGQLRYMRDFRNGVAVLGALPFKFLFVLYTVTNEAGAGLTAGRASATLCAGPRTQAGTEQYLDAVN